MVVPCYNEAARLRTDHFVEFLKSNSEVRFIFVNDGSSDGTLTILQTLAATDPERIIVLDQQPNAGKAEAVRAGMLLGATGSSVVGFWDADLATPLNALPELLHQLQRNPLLEMVFGARVRLLGRRIERRPMRHYLGRVFASVVSVMLQLPIYDTQCGAKLFRVTPDLLQVLDLPFESRWIFDVEIIARFLVLHRSDPDFGKRAIYESPLHQWEDVAGSKVKMSDFVTSFWELIRIRARYLSQ
ncbi:MAG: glycosyl transferase [Acidobacteriaceae bacterium]|nr:glycosyl transferase [Acidobacteriaceae bacterium]